MDLVIWIAVAGCVVSLIYTSLHWYFRVRNDARDFEYIITDIRAMNTYNSYFLAAILVFFGLIIEKGITTIVPKSSLVLLTFAFLFASASIFFIPMKKPQDRADKATNARKLWLYTLILSQFTVILTVLGVLGIGFRLL